MSDEAAREDACVEYQSSLEDLTFNSKPHINMLTILAEENLHFAKDIVAIIEAQIAKAPAAEKLPVLYLVDSIVKNVGGEYLAVFAKNLVTSFICVFEKVDENTRKSLFKLRSTWDDIFPLKKLYALDVRVNSSDPAWPIKPLPPNMNASIHVNPKFLKQTEEVTAPRVNTPQPPGRPTVSEKSLNQEQVIRQQLLAKQKQLLELQQKKIELELEQTKAQLVANQLVSTNTASGSTAIQHDVPKASYSGPAPLTKSWPPPQSDNKASTRDPRLNRAGTAALHGKEPVTNKKDIGSILNTPEKRAHPSIERPGKLDRMTRIPKKDTTAEEKLKSKSLSPLAKGVLGKSKISEPENMKTTDVNKKDPRLRKHVHEKTDSKGEDIKEKKRSLDKKERDDVKSTEQQRSTNTRGKPVNGSLNKHERHETLEKQDSKLNKANVRKRSRSRSPPLHSPKRKGRRSPKRRTSPRRSISPPPAMPGKGRQFSGKHSHTEDLTQHANVREERTTPKKSASEPRRPKRSLEDRPVESRDGHSPRVPSTESKETKANVKGSWKSGWEQNKHLKQPDDDNPHSKSGPQRHKPWTSSQRPTTPRTPKPHRSLSVDANLQIPEVLNSANKRDLLKKANKRLLDGEISHDDFLNVAHQINQLFQYQEEKQRSDSWEGSSDDGQYPSKKKPLLSPPPQQGNLRDAYLEHKSKLRKTQLLRPALRDHHSPMSGERLFHLRPPHDEDDPSQGHSDVQERYGGLPEGVNPFSRHDDPRKSERPPSNSGLPFRNSPSPINLDGSAGKSPVLGFDRPSSPVDMGMEMEQLPDVELSPCPRFESPNSVHSGSGPDDDVPLALEVPSRLDIPSAQGRNVPSSRKPPESPGQTPPHSSEGPTAQTNMPRFDGPNIPQRFDGLKVSQTLFDGAPGPMGQPRSDGPARPPLQSRYEGNTGPGRFDASGGSHGPSRFDGHGRYDASHGSTRFERPPLHKGPERFDRPVRYDCPSMPHGPIRFVEPHGVVRFDGPHPQQGTGRFDCPMGHQGPGRFDGQGPIRFDNTNPMQPNRFDGPIRFDNSHMQQGPGGFEGPMRFPPGPMNFDGPHGQPGPMRFDGPVNQPAALRFENPVQPGPIRYDGPLQGIPFTPPQAPPRYCGLPNLGLPQGHSMFDASQAPGPMTNPSGLPPSNFNMPNRFAEPHNAFGGLPQPFHGQQNVSQASNFNVPPVPAPSGFPNAYRPIAPFPGAPVGNLPQPMTMLPGSLGPPFIPQNPVPFNQPGPQFPQPESHLGQMDVNDLLSKLISTGIIKSAPSDAAPTSESTAALESQPVVAEEEEEEEPDDDDNVPDLTGFVIDDMKQRYDSVVTKLYTGIQCYSCGMRFTASQTDVYADHLDWHYRQNRSEKDISRKVTHRRWYYSLTDWIEFEEIADLEERAKSQFFEKVHEELVLNTQEAAKEKEFQSVNAAPDVVDESCEICQEQFEMYWEEEEEEWHLKDAIRVEEKTYHPSCYEDYKNTSSFGDYTPSPSKVLTENPLNAFIKQEKGDETSCSSIKDEPDTENTDAVAVKEEVQVKLEGESQPSAIIF